MLALPFGHLQGTGPVYDILHVVTGFSTSVPDELGLQAFEIAQSNDPLVAGAGLAAVDCTTMAVGQAVRLGRLSPMQADINL